MPNHFFATSSFFWTWCGNNALEVISYINDLICFSFVILEIKHWEFSSTFFFKNLIKDFCSKVPVLFRVRFLLLCLLNIVSVKSISVYELVKQITNISEHSFWTAVTKDYQVYLHTYFYESIKAFVHYFLTNF